MDATRRAELLARALHRGREGRAFVVLDTQAAGSGDIEAVAAGVDDVAQLDQIAHVVEIAAADHGDAATRGQLPQDAAHLVAEHGEIGAGDDRRQRPIIVEEDARALAGKAPLDLAKAFERIGHGAASLPSNGIPSTLR